LCDTSNPDDFAEGLTQLITNRDKRNRLARAAGQKAAAAYAWPILAKNLANLYVDKKTNF
jgi:glycosyltransferase involved in cell wall biosynthesis